MMPHAFIFAETPVRLWGLTNRQRLERILKRNRVTRWIGDPANVSEEDSVLLLRGDYLYDERLIADLARKPETVLQTVAEDGLQPVAAHVTANDAGVVYAFLNGTGSREKLPALAFETSRTLTTTYQKKLRKIDPPYLLPLTETNRQALEKRLFSGSYKGVTDLVTKWLWPRPAQAVTRFCACKGITPNMVTSVSLMLVIAAGLLFLHGFFGLGLTAAWLMTFLDTVDGKLARVTVNSSHFGHIFDHAIDLVSPPLWYIAWGLSLQNRQPALPLSLTAVLWLIVIGYILGRLVEGVFKQLLEPSGIFCWRPIDSYTRLITARRNPNLILLTVGLLAGRPDLGLLAVTVWTLCSSLFLIGRLTAGFCEQSKSGTALRSWFLDIDHETPRPTLAQRCFSNSRS